jgi:hypothetical protein
VTSEGAGQGLDFQVVTDQFVPEDTMILVPRDILKKMQRGEKMTDEDAKRCSELVNVKALSFTPVIGDVA